MPNCFDTVIFDLDGTLLDSLDDLADSVNQALAKCGFPRFTRKEIRGFVGNGADELIRSTLPQGASRVDYDSVYKLFIEIYTMNMCNKTQPYLGIPELLAELCGRNIKMAVVSNKPQHAVSLLMTDYFDDLITVALGADANTPKKPDPAGLIKAMTQLGTSPERTIYMGDSEIDIVTAKNANVFSVGCTWGFRDRAVLAIEKPDAIIESPLDILPILEK